MFSSPLSAIGQLQQLEISISTKGYIGKWLGLGFVGGRVNGNRVRRRYGKLITPAEKCYIFDS